MSEPLERIVLAPKTSDLSEAIRRVRLVSTEQADGLADLRDAERARLDLLADSLAELIGQVPEDLDFFAFGLSLGETPRLWIDMTCHVALGRDKRTYRLLKDTRLGRTTLHETADRDEMTVHITDYVAERMLDRQRAIEGDWLELSARRARAKAMPLQQPVPADAANEDMPLGRRKFRSRVKSGSTAGVPGGGVAFAFIVGIVIGVGGLAAWVTANGHL